ncbi:hypothetical protein LCGC14_3144320, partial [marine sediment metagenome]
PFRSGDFKGDEMSLIIFILVIFLAIGYGIQIWDEYIKEKRSDK